MAIFKINKCSPNFEYLQNIAGFGKKTSFIEKDGQEGFSGFLQVFYWKNLRCFRVFKPHMPVPSDLKKVQYKNINLAIIRNINY